MKLNLKKLNAIGAAHLLIPMLVVVGAGIIGSFVAVRSMSHADSLNGVKVSSYVGNNDGCGGNATHYTNQTKNGNRKHVGQSKYGTKSYCLCNNGHKVTYTKSYQNMTPNPACVTKTKKANNSANTNSSNTTKIATNKKSASTARCYSSANGHVGTYCSKGKDHTIECGVGKIAVITNIDKSNSKLTCKKYANYNECVASGAYKYTKKEYRGGPNGYTTAHYCVTTGQQTTRQ